MSSHRLVRKDHLVFIAVISTLVITSPSISTYGFFDITKVVYGQPEPDQMNSNSTNSLNIQDIRLQNKIDNLSLNIGLIDKIKDEIRYTVDTNSSKSAIGIGFVDPNGTQFFGYGNLSYSNNAIVDQNTIFGIGSITKVFTTILLADMVKDGIVELSDPMVLWS